MPTMSGSDFGFTMRPSRRDLVLVLAGPEAREHVVPRLQEDGYSVVSASSDSEAQALLGVAHASALVIALDALGEFKATRDVPCVFIGPDDRAVEAARRVGVRTFTTTPHGHDAAETMNDLLARGRSL
jgi:hypothetical protein